MFKNEIKTTWNKKKTNSITLLRIGLGTIFIWFGAIKLVPGLSPAEQIATKAIASLSFDLLTPPYSTLILGLFEVLLGIGIVINRFHSTALKLMYLHLIATIASMFLFPEDTFIIYGFVPTLLGQYIIKNSVLILAGIVIERHTKTC